MVTDNSVVTSLFLNSGKPVRFEVSADLLHDIAVMKNEYSALTDFDTSRGFRNSMIKTAVSDIELESAINTSVVESVAAICCKRIKNKEQQSAINMIALLESGELESSTGISNDYIVNIWKALTYKNNNLEASVMPKRYRLTPVRVIRKGKTALQHEVIHTAPDARNIEEYMGRLCNFYNTEVIHSDPFINAILKAAVFSAYFVYVHPFLDGNGRTSRVFTNKLLIDHGLFKFRYISFTSEIVKHKSEYGKLLEEIERNDGGDITNYINKMVGWFGSLFARLISRQTGKIDISMLNSRQKQMVHIISGSASGTHAKHYKDTWNRIAKANKYPKINSTQVDSDLRKLLIEDLIVPDERYVRFPGFKYFNK